MDVMPRLAVMADGSGRTRTATTGVVAAVVALTLANAWTGTYLAGGTRTVMPHLFYIPVIVAAARFRAIGALVVAAVAGVLCGPMMPLDVAAGTDQSLGNWVTRLGAFVVIGQLTAFMFRHSEESIQHAFGAWVLRRRVDHALATGEFRIEYQPIVELGRPGDRIVGLEALLRWDDRRRGPIPPDRFIPHAEHAGCIGSITRFVVSEVCRQVDVWRATVLADVDDFNVAVNISGSELGDPRLVADIERTLASSRVPASWIHLEITETALVHDVEGAAEGLRRLRELGVKLAIDDFGTGESSLGHLHRFAIDVLKIDRVFLHRLERHDRGHLLIDGIVELAHRLDIVTVAEGIETEAQAAILRDSGCDFAQGYLFARPCRPDAVEQLLAGPDRLRSELGRQSSTR
jgi:EAL domain-containing protein (putative c-di-GMP-specific phosphodiesterase class I)